MNWGRNGIGDDGLDALIRGLPAIVDDLDLAWNEVTLARQLPLWRFEKLDLSGNPFLLMAHELSLRRWSIQNAVSKN